MSVPESISIVESAWDEYRGWAKRGRILRVSVQRLNSYALWCAGVAAVFGAAATGLTQAAAWAETKDALSLDSWLVVGSQAIAVLAAIAAAASPIVGRHLLEIGDEARWLRARAVAEAIKSECFRFAAGVDDYAQPHAARIFLARRAALVEPASRIGLSPLRNDVGAQNDSRRPPLPMTIDWYIANRLEEQQKWYERRQAQNERHVRRLRLGALAAALAGAAIGAISGTLRFSALAPWIAVATTIGVMVVAHGAVDRRQYVAASYGAMAGALARARESFKAGMMDFPALLNTTETLLESEHAAWFDHISRAVVKFAPTPPPAAHKGTLAATVSLDATAGLSAQGSDN